MSNPLYIVTVQHSTGHGPMVSVALADSEFYKALDLARSVEKLAYEFNPDDGVTISRMIPGTVYDHQPGDPSRPHGTHTNQTSQVYWRIMQRDRSWEETFSGHRA